MTEFNTIYTVARKPYPAVLLRAEARGEGRDERGAERRVLEEEGAEAAALREPLRAAEVQADAVAVRRDERRRRRELRRAVGPGLINSVGERPNKTNFRHQNSVKILPEIEKIC